MDHMACFLDLTWRPKREGQIAMLDLPSDDYIEQLLSFPTRGVFAEAKLGHYNASGNSLIMSFCGLLA
jgi:hypothetical protein